MNSGRWYPTVVILHDGTALVMSGSFAAPNGRIQQTKSRKSGMGGVEAACQFPRHAALSSRSRGSEWSSLHVRTARPDLHAGYQWSGQLDTPSGAGRVTGQRPDGITPPLSCMKSARFSISAGVTRQTTHVPTAAAEIIDLTAANPAWRPTAPMHHPRRQHNATILPDGTVLVTGGTKGGGGKNPGFNDLTKGKPVHVAELWDPMTGQWTLLAAEEVDRCYHATAILLPDATVLSAGGGEYRPDGSPTENPPQDSHRDGQIFHPPYLFRGPRPDLTTAPQEVAYGQSFTVGTSRPEEIGLVNWIRLSSVTHSFNMDQRINFLAFRPATGGLTITAPEGPDVCPPGHYMLFLLSKAKVPSIAKILRIAAPAGSHRLAMFQPADARAHVVPAEVQMSTAELDAKIIREAPGTRAAVGLTSRCPYGLGACWGGAYEALQKLDGVQAVRPIANAEDFYGRCLSAWQYSSRC